MEFKSTKRKKKKTRKHLNELRKRSQNVYSSKYRERQSDCNRRVSESSLVTTDRLTLAIFPKVIRSATVTRSSKVDISEESENYVNVSSKIVTKSNYDPLAETTLSSDENWSIVKRCSDLEQLSPNDKNSTLSISPPSKSQNCIDSDQFSRSLKENSCKEIIDNMSHYLEKITKREEEYISSPTNKYFDGNAINNSCAVSEEPWSSETSHFNNEDPVEISTLGCNREDSPTFFSPCPTSRDIVHDSPEYIYYPHKLN